MSYDPNAKIDEFIRESVLEEKKVDLSKLSEIKNKIDNKLYAIKHMIKSNLIKYLNNLMFFV